MDAASIVEQAIRSALASQVTAGQTPPALAAALEAALFPGGARLRPRLCLAVASACEAGAERVAVPAAVALELLHCASLVHDDLPCFDDAELRRGRPTVHAAFGESLAVLAGDALIVMAFRSLAETPLRLPQLAALTGEERSTARPRTCEVGLDPARFPALLACVADAVGPTKGITGGQAWELEPHVAVSRYHQLKTGALFEASARAGAIAAGHDPEPWGRFGAKIGEAYQVADDLHDALGSSEDLGKPVGKDLELGRPSAVHRYGTHGAMQRLSGLLSSAIDAVPGGADRAPVEEWLALVGSRLLPRKDGHSSATTESEHATLEGDARVLSWAQ